MRDSILTSFGGGHDLLVADTSPGEIEAQVLGHVSDLVDLDQPFCEAPLALSTREAVLVAAADDRLEG